MDANGNSISPINKLIYRTLRESSESRSEASSVDSDFSDITNIALQLGVNPEDLANERFKVDRQKMENMIKNDSATEGMNGAECFFKNIMETTSTRISWPCRLKIGAKTKKDPHVRIVGKPVDVMKAKDRILAALDSRGCRVIMKMDISYTDHSYIIGRGGKNIKKIMEDTLTHIHFPDSNRTNTTEKSNQVSLCGSLEGVEKARALVRYSTPLIISFELPIMVSNRPVPDNDDPYVKNVETTFDIQVIFSSRSKLHSSLVLVKGSEKEAQKVKDATQLLINYMCDSVANQIHVNLQLEISPNHHEIVKGKHNMELLNIMEQTKTKIIFPDVNDVNIKPIKKSQVTIAGTIDGVYNARQQLIGNLPIALIFDYPENSVNPDDIALLNNKYGVYIAPRHKSRQSTICIVIKGVEKFVDKIYGARHELLNLPTPLVKADIPLTYFAKPGQDIGSIKNLVCMSFPDSPLTPGVQHSFAPNFQNSSFVNQFMSRPLSNQAEFPKIQNQQVSPGNVNRFQPIQQSSNQNINNSMASNGMTSFSTGRASMSPQASSTNTSGYISIHGSSNSLEQLYPPYKPNLQANGSGISHFSPPENQTFSSASGSNISCRLSNESGNHSFENTNRTPTSSYALSQRISEYDAKRIEGYKAMERHPLTPAVRTPNNAWAGLALSKTSPFVLESASGSQWTHREKGTPFDKGSTTSMLAVTPAQDRSALSEFKDIHSLMTHLKLDHYISNFVVNEIDLEMFASLTAENLVELGITAFGARKRLLFAISQLNSEMHPTLGRFSGSAAPGAERRPSSGW